MALLVASRPRAPRPRAALNWLSPRPALSGRAAILEHKMGRGQERHCAAPALGPWDPRELERQGATVRRKRPGCGAPYHVLLRVHVDRDPARLRRLGLGNRQAEQAVLVVRLRLAGIQLGRQGYGALEAAEPALAVQVLSPLRGSAILAADRDLAAEHLDVDAVRVDAGQGYLEHVVVALDVHVHRDGRGTGLHGAR